MENKIQLRNPALNEGQGLFYQFLSSASVSTAQKDQIRNIIRLTEESPELVVKEVGEIKNSDMFFDIASDAVAKIHVDDVREAEGVLRRLVEEYQLEAFEYFYGTEILHRKILAERLMVTDSIEETVNKAKDEELYFHRSDSEVEIHESVKSLLRSETIYRDPETARDLYGFLREMVGVEGKDLERQKDYISADIAYAYVRMGEYDKADIYAQKIVDSDLHTEAEVSTFQENYQKRYYSTKIAQLTLDERFREALLTKKEADEKYTKEHVAKNGGRKGPEVVLKSKFDSAPIERAIRKKFMQLVTKDKQAAAEFLREIPEAEFSLFRKCAVDLYRLVIASAKRRAFAIDSDPAMRRRDMVKEQVREMMSDHPDILLIGCTSGIDVYFTQDEKIDLLVQTGQLNEREPLTASVGSRIIGNFNNLPLEQAERVRPVLFDAYAKTFDTALLQFSATFFKEHFAALSGEERRSVLDGFIEHNPFDVIQSLADPSLLEGDQNQKLKKLLIERNEFYIFVAGPKSKVEDFGWDRETVLLEIVEEKPEKLFNFLCDSTPNSIGGKSVKEILPDSVAYALIEKQFAASPGGLLKKGKDILPIDEHEFTRPTVLLAYTSVVTVRIPMDWLPLYKTIEDVTGIAPDYKEIFESSLAGITYFKRMVDITTFAEKVSSSEFLPWAGPIKRLEKVQARSARDEHDPWITELNPLVNTLLDNQELSFFFEEDGDLLVDFVETFGAINALNLFRVFKDLKRAETKADISSENADRLKAFIGTRRYEDKLQTPAEILNEIQRQKRRLVTGLLDDKVPSSLHTELGEEVFYASVGSTSWDRESDKVSDLATLWKKTVAEAAGDKEHIQLPEEYREHVLQVQKRSRAEAEKAQEADEKKKASILHGKGLVSAFDRFYAVAREIEQTQNVESYVEMLRRQLINQLKKKEKSAVARRELMKGTNDAAFDLISKNLEDLRTNIQAFEMMDFGFLVSGPPSQETSELKEGAYEKAMEEFVAFGFKGETAKKILKAISWDHLKTYVFGWSAISDPVSNFMEPTEENIRNIAQFQQHYLSEHHLNPNQEVHDLVHEPFSEKLRYDLADLWMVSKDKGEDPFSKAYNKLRAVDEGVGMSDEMIDVALVPAQGLLRVFAGDLADGCHTSQHNALARGEMPGVHAMVFVTGRGKASERFAGSALFIETEGEHVSEDKVLLVRANNPRENLIQDVDAKALVKQTLEAAIETAKARGMERVVVPLDNASESSSNRPAVSSFYAEHFSENPKIGLIDEEETNFNGYESWDSEGGYPCVEIWNRTDGKIGEWAKL